MLSNQEKINKKGIGWYWQQAVLSPYFMLVVVAINLITHFTAQDLIGFYVFAGLLAFILLTTKDGKIVILFSFFAYTMISVENGPSNGGNYDFTYYRSPEMMQMYWTMGGLLVAVFLLKIFTTKGWWQKIKSCKFNAGIIIFSICMLANGLDIGQLSIFEGSGWHSDYYFNNLVVAVMELTFWFGLAYLYVVTVDWEKDGLTYVAQSITLASATVAIQLAVRIVQQYYAGNLIGPEGDILRESLHLGWGVGNNVGPMLVLGVPTALYLAHKLKRGWLYYLLALFFVGMQIFVQCRTSLLTSAVVMLVGTVLLLATTKYRKRFVICFALLIGLVAVVMFFFAEPFRTLFARYFEKGMNDSGRFVLWQNGLNDFIQNPLFGTGFTPDIGLDNSTIFCNMYHNEFIQIIACCGLFGFAGFAIHKFQLWTAILQKPNKEKLWLGLSFLGIFVMSMTDNNWFLPFVGMPYASLLAGLNYLLQKQDEQQKSDVIKQYQAQQISN